MSRPTEQEEQEIHKGTEALKDIANDVEAEREKSAGKSSVPSDEAEQAVEPPLENPQDEDAHLPAESGEVPVHPPARPMM